MIGATHSLAPETSKSIDGVEPVDMIVSLESQLNALENQAESTLRDIAQSLSFGLTLEDLRLNPDKEMFQYALEKYSGVTDSYLSLEDISNSSKKIWDRTVSSLKQLQTDTIEYAKVINLGADRLVDKVNMLYEQSQAIKNPAYKQEFTLKAPKKFNIDGRYEPKNVLPVVGLTTSIFNFYDKVFLKYIDETVTVFDKLSFNNDFTQETGIDFDKFKVSTWMVKPELVTEEDRIRVAVPIYRTPAIQSNRAIYASGPGDKKLEQLNWPAIVNSVRDFSFRFYTVRSLKESDGEGLIVEVSTMNDLSQRLGQLLILSRKFQSRKGYESKLAQALRKIQTAGEKIRTKAGQFKVEPDEADRQDPNNQSTKGRPAISDVIQSVTIMINNVSRMVTDYNNALAGTLRTLGGLTYVAELELKAYQHPIRKPIPKLGGQNVT